MIFAKGKISLLICYLYFTCLHKISLKEYSKTQFRFGIQFSRCNDKTIGGAKRDRTADLLRARQALSQLSYSPKLLVNLEMVGLSGLEPPTSPLSGVRSNQLS